MTAAYAQIAGGPYFRQRAFYIAGDGSVASSAQTVEVTFSGTADECGLEVISLQGVDSATPVGTAVTSNTNGATPSVTVGSVGSDDFVVDHIYAGDGLATASSGPGANQTLGTERVISANNIYSASSYQDGADGGVMSWALTGTPTNATLLGAIAFKPAAGGAAAALSIAPLVQNYRNMGLMQ